MRFSHLFIQTQRPTPGDQTPIGMQFLERAGYIRQVEAGIFGMFPLATRTLQKMQASIRQDLNHLSGQEIDLPIFVPEERKFTPSLNSPYEFPSLNVATASHRNWLLTQTATKYLLDLVQHTIRSHRQLPRLLYQFQDKIVPGNQSQNSLLASKVAKRLECFLLDDETSHEKQNFQKFTEAFHRLLLKWNFPYQVIEDSDPSSFDFYYLHPNGNQNILYCSSCGYQKNQKNTSVKKSEPDQEEMLPLEEVLTPETKTIESLSNFLHIPNARTAKAVFLTATIPEGNEIVERVVIAIVRGDMELDETKLARAIKAHTLRPSTEAEITSVGAIPGFASPVGLEKGLVVIDELIQHSRNLVAGANKKNYHLKNVNYERDYKAHIIADITVAKAGDLCPQCQQPLALKKGYLVGQISQPDSQFSPLSGCFIQDETGQQKTIQFSYAWMDIEKIFGAIAETNNDQFGLILPYLVSPFQVHLVVLPSKNSNEPTLNAEKIYKELMRARIDVLFDDRSESPGTKFNDADLIGIPLRITVAEKSLNQGGVEMKLRREKEKKLVNLADIIPTTMHTLLQLEREVAQLVAKSFTQ